jgi:uncharacterized protein YjdB
MNMKLTDKQHCEAGITLLDLDGEPFATKPDDVSVSFASDNPAVADFVVGPDGMNGDVTSVSVGTTQITATVTLGDGTVLTGSLPVEVVNSAPGSVNFTAGTPTDE